MTVIVKARLVPQPAPPAFIQQLAFGILRAARDIAARFCNDLPIWNVIPACAADAGAHPSGTYLLWGRRKAAPAAERSLYAKDSNNSMSSGKKEEKPHGLEGSEAKKAFGKKAKHDSDLSIPPAYDSIWSNGHKGKDTVKLGETRLFPNRRNRKV